MTVIGARPEIIQTAPFSRAVRADGHREVLVHTGQHYDTNMSDVFFRDLGVPHPDHNLEVGSSSHAAMTAQIMVRLEPLMLHERPDWVVVFGDTNSTLAGALVAAKLCIPLAHIEAGLRSGDRTMPEEVNRVLVDHISDLLLAPTDAAVANLQREGLTRGVQLVGDVRVDVLRGLIDRARARLAGVLAREGVPLKPGEPFALATIHRAANTDDRGRLRALVAALDSLPLPVVLPVHPRLAKMLKAGGLNFKPGGSVYDIAPLGFLDLLALLDGCRLVITDSGGLQKEAYMLRRPCVTVRDTTEWVETVASGWNRLSDVTPGALGAAVSAALAPPPDAHPEFYGTPGVTRRIVALLAHGRE
jgi:UDP-GlcNAc3NAcA epimerase